MSKDVQLPAEGIMKKKDFSWSSKWYTVDCDCGHANAVMDLSCDTNEKYEYTDIALTWYVDMTPKIDWSWKPWRIFFRRTGMAIKLLFGQRIEWQESFVFTGQQARNIGSELIRAADTMEANRQMWNEAKANGADTKQLRQQMDGNCE